MWLGLALLMISTVTLVLGAPGYTSQRLDSHMCSSSVCLPEGYNQMDMPGPSPLVIRTQLMLTEIYEVNAQDFSVHFNLFMIFFWQDDRLNVTEVGKVNVDRDFIRNIWTPDFYIYHMKRIENGNGITDIKGLTVEKANDTVLLSYSIDANVQFMCGMDFSSFPFESNVCKFRLSSYSITMEKIVFEALTQLEPGKMLTKDKVRDYDVAVDYLEGEDTIHKTNMAFNEGRNYSVVGLSIRLTNKHSKYIWVYYLPTSMFTATSWVGQPCISGVDFCIKAAACTQNPLFRCHSCCRQPPTPPAPPSWSPCSSVRLASSTPLFVTHRTRTEVV
jgi:hypothetical protein